MSNPSVNRLLADLKSEDETVRLLATQELWQIWFQQKGMVGLELIKRSQIQLEDGNVEVAESILNQLIRDQPDFAEAWNRRAVLYYTQENYQLSLKDCQTVVQLNPNHFGAWHGIGLCQMALRNYVAAIPAFRRALEIQPYAIANQRLLLECTLNSSSS
jgi:tetratricopeptide (TPR) repeat protein